jgi:hypothetical protein
MPEMERCGSTKWQKLQRLRSSNTLTFNNTRLPRFSIIHLEQSRLSCSNSEMESLFCSSCRFRWRELDLSLESGNGVKHTQHVWLIEVWVSKKSTGNSDYSQRVPSRNASRNTYTCIDPTVEATSIHSLGQVKPHQHRRNHQIGDRCCVHVLYGQYLTHEC